MKVSVEDSVAINDLIAQYCYYVDYGFAEEWANLFTEDGELIGLGDPLVGREQLKMLPPMAALSNDGTSRHQITNLFLVYGPTQEEVRMRGSGLMTKWEHGGEFICFAAYDAQLVRVDGEWKIKKNVANRLPRTIRAWNDPEILAAAR
jgi:hypothetical protein